MIRCRHYRFGDPVVDYVSCNSECAVTIFKNDNDSYWLYYSLGCEQNCYPTNYSYFGVAYIKTCCFNDLCSLNVLHLLHPVFPSDVIVKRINNDAYHKTSTITYTTSYTIATISAVIAPSPVETTVIVPSLLPHRNGMCNCSL